MSGYIISDDEITIKTLKNYKITSFDIPCDNFNKNIYIIKNKKISYTKNKNYKYNCFKNKIEKMATMNDDAHVLEWLFCSKYTFTFYDIDNIISHSILYYKIKILEWVHEKGYNITFKHYQFRLIDNFELLTFFKKINLKFSPNPFQILNIRKIKSIEWLILNKPIKKIIKFMNVKNFKKYVKTICFKTKNNYFKGYNKN
jgi:hypothetical protein